MANSADAELEQIIRRINDLLAHQSGQLNALMIGVAAVLNTHPNKAQAAAAFEGTVARSPMAKPNAPPKVAQGFQEMVRVLRGAIDGR